MSGKRRYKQLPGKTEPKSEKKSRALPAETQQKFDNPPLPDQTKNWKESIHGNMGLLLCQVRINQS